MAVTVHPSLTKCQAAGFSSGDDGTGWAKGFGRTIRLWRSRIRERRTVTSLDYRDLRDLGLSRWDVERELAKPFWRG